MNETKNKYLLLLFIAISLRFEGYTENRNPLKPTSFIETTGAFGTVFNTNDFIPDGGLNYSAFSLRYARASNGSSWEDFAYNMPYFGVGFYKPNFVDNPGLGNPFSLYLFRGSTLKQFTNNLGLILEMGLGLSMNWDPYDPFDNPENVAVSTPNNVHVGLRLYFEYALSRHWDLKFGGDLNHFSNGALRKPNKGVNMGALSLALAYNFNPPNKGSLLRNPPLLNPPSEIPPRIDHDVKVIVSSRQTDFDTNGTGLPLYVNASFMVLGLSYNPMIVKGYRYKWGPSVRFLYDESSNATAWREQNTANVRVATAPLKDRLSLGLGLTGEISMPIASVFATLGYSVYHKHHEDKALYQVIGIKAYLQDNLFATFGISATQLSVAQFLYWSFGYTFSSKPLKR